MENKASDPRETLWRRPVAGPARELLRAQPELELDARLTEALAQLPNAPVPSNFTARVMGAIELEEACAARSRGGHWNWRRLWPRLTTATAIALFAVLGFQHYESGVKRAEMARSLSLVASASTPPSVEALNNFDAIQRMSESGRADVELLAALQ
jgi:hypothetical protein